MNWIWKDVFCCPFALKEKFTPSRSAYATLSAPLRRPLTINHNIKRKADDPWQSGTPARTLRLTASLCQGQDKSSAYLYNPYARAVASLRHAFWGSLYARNQKVA